MKHLTIVVLVFLAYTSLAEAEPRVIADLGGKSSGIKSPTDLIKAKAKEFSGLNHAPEIGIKQFPVISAIKTGVLESRRNGLPIARPFFIIGDDPDSREWLSTNAEVLGRLNALGVVANVLSPQGLQELKALAPSLALIAAPADEIAKTYSLESYPVLVTQREILQ